MSATDISEDKLNSFIGVTGATLERAKFYLEAANGDLDVRILLTNGPKKNYTQKYPFFFNSLQLGVFSREATTQILSKKYQNQLDQMLQ